MRVVPQGPKPLLTLTPAGSRLENRALGRRCLKLYPDRMLLTYGRRPGQVTVRLADVVRVEVSVLGARGSGPSQPFQHPFLTPSCLRIRKRDGRTERWHLHFMDPNAMLAPLLVRLGLNVVPARPGWMEWLRDTWRAK